MKAAVELSIDEVTERVLVKIKRQSQGQRGTEMLKHLDTFSSEEQEVIGMEK